MSQARPSEQLVAHPGIMRRVRTGMLSTDAGRERLVMVAIWFVAVLGCVLGITDPASAGSHENVLRQVVDVARVVGTTALAVTLLLGPGLAGRAAGVRLRLGFLWLPGFGGLLFTAALAWMLAGTAGAHVVCDVLVGAILAGVAGTLALGDRRVLLDADERHVLMLAGLLLGIAIARSVWEFGPLGELYDGTIVRTLNAEPRPDSFTSYLVAEMVAHGTHPYGHIGAGLFLPYNFSSRGPLPGMASAPIMLATGARPTTASPPLYPWAPFDAEGMMAFRIAIMTFTSSCVLSVWELVRRLGGVRAARFAALLCVSTPFVLNDMIFTWPKLLAGSCVILAALLIVESRPLRAGLMVSAGYLMHPSALLSVLGLAPIAVWPVRGARLRQPRVLHLVLLAVGVLVAVEGWRYANGPFYQQNEFNQYLKQAYPYVHPTPWEWIRFRWTSLADTLIPLYLPGFEGHSLSINVFGGRSPGVIHFFFQEWTGAPFGFGIFFYPLLLVTLWRAGRRWPWPVVATVVWPFLAFWVYWGASITGLLREGLQAWVLGVIAVVALEQAARNFSWRGSVLVRTVLVLRALEVLAVAIASTLWTNGFVIVGRAYPVTDGVSFAVVLVCAGLLMRAVWRNTSPLHTPDPAAVRPTSSLAMFRRGPAPSVSERS